MNLSRAALIQLEKNMRTTLADNERTRKACAAALQEFGNALARTEKRLLDADRSRAEEASRQYELMSECVWRVEFERWTFMERLRWLFTGRRWPGPEVTRGARVQLPPEGV